MDTTAVCWAHVRDVLGFTLSFSQFLYNGSSVLSLSCLTSNSFHFLLYFDI